MFNIKQQTDNSQSVTLTRREKKNSPMERVKQGEEFMVVGDRFENRYRFDKIDSQHWALCWNNLIVAAATAGNFFLQGFVINMRVLGQVSRLQVLTEDVRFVKDQQEGGKR